MVRLAFSTPIVISFSNKLHEAHLVNLKGDVFVLKTTFLSVE